MTLNELRYLVAVAQEKSFGRAAQRCFISQPALSVAIQKLEEELGAQLFERAKRDPYVDFINILDTSSPDCRSSKPPAVGQAVTISSSSAVHRRVISSSAGHT